MKPPFVPLWAWLGIVAGLFLTGWLTVTFGLNALFLVIAAGLAVPLALVILRRPELGLLFVLFFLPFERIPSVDVGGVTMRINFLIGGLTLLATGLAWLRRELPPTKHPLLVPTLLILGAAAASLFAAVELQRGIVTFIFILFTVSFAWFTVELLRTPAEFARATRVLWWSALVVGLFGIYQFFGDLAGLPTGLSEGYTKIVFGFPRIQAFSREPLYLGNWLLLPLSLLGSTLLLKPKELYRPWLWWLLALIALILVLTVSRGAYLGAAAAAAVLIVTLPRQLLEPKHLLISLGLGLAVVVGTLGFLSRGESGALQEFVSHATIRDFGSGESTQSRLAAVGDALRAWEAQPITGIGLGNFGAFVHGYPNPAVEPITDIVNNQYAELLAETGPLGLLAFLLILGILVIRGVVAFRATSDPLLRAGILGTTAALVGVAVQYNFFSTLYIIHVWVFIGLAVAVQTMALAPKTLDVRPASPAGRR